MINQALLHCRGVGPIRWQHLIANGICCWQDVIERPETIPKSMRAELLAEAERCMMAYLADDIGYFTQHLHPEDRWRILHQYLPRASFFDIETTGLEYDDSISVIACWHKNQLHTFVEHENLDEFLDLLDDIQLLVSFNGSTFDVPRTLATFHVPELPCPHLDLRWPCFHHGLSGGLKHVADALGIQRPHDLANADGQLAIWLWERWQTKQDQTAREKLLRYCGADVILMRPIASHIARRTDDYHDLWNDLPETETSTTFAPDERKQDQRIRVQLTASLFGPASPKRLRTRR